MSGPPQAPRTVGEHLLKRRRDLGLTQVQVAEALGVNVSTVTIWEKNRGEPSGGHLAGILGFLGYDPLSGLPALGRPGST
jgi:transcriptional regulator with XRE-family HTH domain